MKSLCHGSAALLLAALVSMAPVAGAGDAPAADGREAVAGPEPGAPRGGCGEAVDHITAAIAGAPEFTDYREQLARFEKMKAEAGPGR